MDVTNICFASINLKFFNTQKLITLTIKTQHFLNTTQDTTLKIRQINIDMFNNMFQHSILHLKHSRKTVYSSTV